jgi:putative transposase
MRKSKFSEKQIVSILKDTESGVPVSDPVRKRGIGKAVSARSSAIDSKRSALGTRPFTIGLPPIPIPTIALTGTTFSLALRTTSPTRPRFHPAPHHPSPHPPARRASPTAPQPRPAALRSSPAALSR